MGTGCQEGGSHSGSSLSIEAAGLTGAPCEEVKGQGTSCQCLPRRDVVGEEAQAASVRTLSGGILSSPQLEPWKYCLGDATESGRDMCHILDLSLAAPR